MNDQPNPRPRRFGAQFFVTLLLVLIAAAAGWKVAKVVQVEKPLAETKNENSKIQLGLPSSDDGAHLAEGLVDEDGDMIADPPKDASKLVDPPTLVFCYIAQEEEGETPKIWKPFC